MTKFKKRFSFFRMNALTKETRFYKKLLHTGCFQRVTVMQLSWWEINVILTMQKRVCDIHVNTCLVVWAESLPNILFSFWILSGILIPSGAQSWISLFNFVHPEEWYEWSTCLCSFQCHSVLTKKNELTPLHLNKVVRLAKHCY